MVDKKKSYLKILCQSLLCSLFLHACDQGKDINLHESRRTELTNYHPINPEYQYDDPFNINKFSKIAANDNIISKPIIHQNDIYFIDKKGILYSVSVKTDVPSINWKKLLILNKNNIGHAGITYNNGLLYITTGQRELIILDATTAEEKARKVIPDISYTAPVVEDNIIIVQTINNKLYAYDLFNNFALAWFYDTSLGEIMIQKDSSFYDCPKLIKNKDCLLLNHGPQKIAYIKIKDGQILWSTDLGNIGDTNLFGATELSSISAQPVFDNNYAYISSSDDKLFKIQLSNGKIEWEKQIFAIQSINHVDSNKLSVTTSGKQLLIISKKSGDNLFVGELVDIKSKKNKLEYMFMHPPLIGKNDQNNISLNVVAIKNHSSYLFSFEDINKATNIGHQFNILPKVQQYIPYISYYAWDSVDKTLFIVSKNNIYFKKMLLK